MSRDKTKRAKRVAASKRRDRVVKNASRRMDFRIDILVDGVWKHSGFWLPRRLDVDVYEAEQEEIRQRGDVQIFPGKIVEVATGRVVAEVAGYDPPVVGKLESDLDERAVLNKFPP